MTIGAEIGFIRARKTGPNPEIEVKYDITSYPAFHPRLWLQHWMHITTIQVELLLSEFSDAD